MCNVMILATRNNIFTLFLPSFFLKLQARSILIRLDEILVFVFPDLRNDQDPDVPFGFLAPSKFRTESLEPILFSSIYSILFTLYKLNIEVSLCFC